MHLVVPPFQALPDSPGHSYTAQPVAHHTTVKITAPRDQQAIGTAVVGGMIAATVMSLIFTPVFFVIMRRLSERKRKGKAAETALQKEASS